MHWVRLSQLELQADFGVVWYFSGVGVTLCVKAFDLVLLLELTLLVALVVLDLDSVGCKLSSIVF